MPSSTLSTGPSLGIVPVDQLVDELMIKHMTNRPPDAHPVGGLFPFHIIDQD